MKQILKFETTSFLKSERVKLAKLNKADSPDLEREIKFLQGKLDKIKYDLHFAEASFDNGTHVCWTEYFGNHNRESETCYGYVVSTSKNYQTTLVNQNGREKEISTESLELDKSYRR